MPFFQCAVSTRRQKAQGASPTSSASRSKPGQIVGDDGVQAVARRPDPADATAWVRVLAQSRSGASSRPDGMRSHARSSGLLDPAGQCLRPAVVAWRLGRRRGSRPTPAGACGPASRPPLLWPGQQPGDRAGACSGAGQRCRSSRRAILGSAGNTAAVVGLAPPRSRCPPSGTPASSQPCQDRVYRAARQPRLRADLEPVHLLRRIGRQRPQHELRRWRHHRQATTSLRTRSNHDRYVTWSPPVLLGARILRVRIGVSTSVTWGDHDTLSGATGVSRARL